MSEDMIFIHLFIPTFIHLVLIRIPFIRDYYYDYIERSYVYNKQELSRFKSWWSRHQSHLISESKSSNDNIANNALYVIDGVSRSLIRLYKVVNVLKTRLKSPVVIHKQ